MDKITDVKNYEYQLLRYRHDVAAGEFVNVGLVYFDPQTRFLRVRMTERYGRLSDFFGNVEGRFLIKSLKKLQSEFKALAVRYQTEIDFNQFSTVSALTTSVLPKDDNTLFFSDIFKGFHFDHHKSFDSLYERLIGRYTDEKNEQRHDDNYVWKNIYKKYFDEQGITATLKEHNVKTDNDVIEFDHAAKNGIWHCVQPISFDLMKTGDIKEKIYRWSGIINELKSTIEPLHVYLLSLMPLDTQLQRMIEQKLNVTQENLTVQVIEEKDASQIAHRLKITLAHSDN